MTKRVEGGATYTQTFNAENRLVTVQTVTGTTTFTYDGDGSRVKKVAVSGGVTVTTLYAGPLEVEITGTQRITTSYYFAGAQLIAMREVSSTGTVTGTLYYLIGDHLGSTSVTLDKNGNVVAEQRYYAYGQVRYTSGATPTDRQFTGQYNDGSALGGLYFFNARYYSSSGLTQRWLNRPS